MINLCKIVFLLIATCFCVNLAAFQADAHTNDGNTWVAKRGKETLYLIATPHYPSLRTSLRFEKYEEIIKRAEVFFTEFYRFSELDVLEKKDAVDVSQSESKKAGRLVISKAAHDSLRDLVKRGVISEEFFRGLGNSWPLDLIFRLPAEIMKFYHPELITADSYLRKNYPPMDQLILQMAQIRRYPIYTLMNGTEMAYIHAKLCDDAEMNGELILAIIKNRSTDGLTWFENSKRTIELIESGQMKNYAALQVYYSNNPEIASTLKCLTEPLNKIWLGNIEAYFRSNSSKTGLLFGGAAHFVARPGRDSFLDLLVKNGFTIEKIAN